tara:strand:- start:101 stop:232 length:132 start_codon:yes stop_codon:yes gene_type:complete
MNVKILFLIKTAKNQNSSTKKILSKKNAKTFFGISKKLWKLKS